MVSLMPEALRSGLRTLRFGTLFDVMGLALYLASEELILYADIVSAIKVVYNYTHAIYPRLDER